MDNKCHAITFYQGDYMNKFYIDKHCFNREDVDFIQMYSDIADFIRIAIHNGYQMKIWSDEYTVCIEYNYQDEGTSGVSLEWIGEDEYVEKYGDHDAEGETSAEVQ